MRLSRTLPAALAAAALCAACDLSVTNPGPVQDAQLDNPAAVPALVNGMSGDLSYALGNYLAGNVVMTDEMSHSGNYAAPNNYAVGIIRSDDVDPDYSRMQQARWVAEDGLRRMQRVLGSDFESNANTPRAYLYAGFANRLLGENSCAAVIDGSPMQSDSVYFQRAESLFTRANVTATALKNATVATAALAGRASVRAALGDWTGAVADAQQVPTNFVFNAVFSLNTSRENMDLAYETRTRREFSVWGTQWARVSHTDPRTPWDTVKTSSGKIQTGQDGKTPYFIQNKYKDLGANVPLAKGTEMLLLRAEAALRGGDVTGAVTLINQERAAYGLAGATATTTADAWTLLQNERGAVLWLEGRRLWDLRRWNAEGTNSFLNGRDKCMPIGTSEIASNPNF